MPTSRTWLVLDCNFLCWRAAYSYPSLEYEGRPTGVVYGFLKEVCHLVKAFNTGDLVFCFDAGKRLKRQDYFADYKKDRQHFDPDCPNRRQIADLRDNILPALGYPNVLTAPGFEADDLIAATCKVISDVRTSSHRAVVVSADKDLYQLLGPAVNMWNPILKESTTAGQFTARWGIKPRQWATVKAIAGCGSDQVPGVPGVAEKTASLYVQDPRRCPKAKKIEDHFDLINRNVQLVTLPYPGTPVPVLETAGGPTPKEWIRFCDALGFKSLRDEHPSRRYK